MTDIQGPDVIEAGLRLRAIVVCDVFLRLMRASVECFGDMEGATIYLAVAAASAGGATRDPEVQDLYSGPDPLPDRYHRPVSRRAISQSTGLPRETVRRRIAELVRDGHLVEEAKGVRTRSNALLERDNLAFVRRAILEIERGGERLRR